jgi:hypothetical protein
MTRFDRVTVWVAAVRFVAWRRTAVSRETFGELVREAGVYVEAGVGPGDAVDFASVHVLNRQGLPAPERLRRPRALGD